MVDELLSQPVPIVFTVVQGVQQLANGTFNLLSIFDKMIVYRMPDGTAPDTVTIQVVTVWTGGRGEFEQVLAVLDQDGNPLGDPSPQRFTLTGTSARQYNVSLVNIPAREGVFTLTVGRPDQELLRQDFTIELQPFPGTAQ